VAMAALGGMSEFHLVIALPSRDPSQWGRAYPSLVVALSTLIVSLDQRPQAVITPCAKHGYHLPLPSWPAGRERSYAGSGRPEPVRLVC
jgi:hypothetical protein